MVYRWVCEMGLFLYVSLCRWIRYCTCCCAVRLTDEQKYLVFFLRKMESICFCV